MRIGLTGMPEAPASKAPQPGEGGGGVEILASQFEHVLLRTDRRMPRESAKHLEIKLGAVWLHKCASDSILKTGWCYWTTTRQP